MVNSQTRVAYYVCRKCERTFQADIKSVEVLPGRNQDTGHPKECPGCGAKYFTWLNFKEFEL